MHLFLKSLWGHFVVRYHLAFGVGRKVAEILLCST